MIIIVIMLDVECQFLYHLFSRLFDWRLLAIGSHWIWIEHGNQTVYFWFLKYIYLLAVRKKKTFVIIILNKKFLISFHIC